MPEGSLFQKKSERKQVFDRGRYSTSGDETVALRLSQLHYLSSSFARDACWLRSRYKKVDRLTAAMVEETRQAIEQERKGLAEGT